MSEKAIEAAAKAVRAARNPYVTDPTEGTEYDLRIARAAIAAYEAAMWRPIDEWPKNGKLLQTWNGKSIQRGFWDPVDCAWVLAFKTTTKRKPIYPPPTHAHPLPQPPEVK